MIGRAFLLQGFALLGNFMLFPFYYLVLRPLRADDTLVLAFAATIPLAWLLSSGMLIWDEVKQQQAGCIGWLLMVSNLFLMALNVGVAVALSEQSGASF